MWEDDVLYDGERADWSSGWLEKSRWLIDQLVFSRVIGRHSRTTWPPSKKGCSPVCVRGKVRAAEGTGEGEAREEGEGLAKSRT